MNSDKEIFIFRFQKLIIWQEAIGQSHNLLELSEKTREKRLFRFADQLDGSVLSISNNIAEGSGAASKKEFARYLAIARASLFEVVNILHILELRNIITTSEKSKHIRDLYGLSRKIYAFRQSLLK